MLMRLIDAVPPDAVVWLLGRWRVICGARNMPPAVSGSKRLLVKECHECVFITGPPFSEMADPQLKTWTTSALRWLMACCVLFCVEIGC